jgi:hypothetical protein
MKRKLYNFMARETLIQLRRGTSTQWACTNPVLEVGEVGFETDTKKLKIGDGSSQWNSLYVRLDGGNLDSPNPPC